MRSLRLWFVTAGLLVGTMPVLAQEVILEIPERKPPPATPAPARKPDAPVPTAKEAVPPPAPRPEVRETPPTPPPDSTMPEAVSTEDTTPAETAPTETATSQDAASESVAPGDLMTDEEAAAAATRMAGPPPPPLRKPLPGDRPTRAWKDAKVAAGRKECTKLLKGLTLDYDRLQPIKRGACGAPAPILVKSIGADLPVAISPPATMRCRLAVALDKWLNDQVQPAALEAFGSPVIKIRNISSYKCRNRYNAANTKISEHAFANALDISEFELASGKKITVLRGWPRLVKPAGPPPLPVPKPLRDAPETTDNTEVTMISAMADEPPSPPPEASPPSGPEPRDASEFLRLIHADACKTFNTVLGPKANAAHANHFHVDMKVRRYVTICE